jgi:hypothetical protein
MGADNQQERSRIEGWITGFVDGEGCFSVTLQRNLSSKLGWQVFPEFVVTQGAKSLTALRFLRDHFGCGTIHINNRKDNHKEPIYRFCVRSIRDLSERIIPFFEANPLRTAKADSFRVFCGVLKCMAQKQHLTLDGLREIAIMASSINRQKVPRFLKSSETIRQATE